MGTCKFRDPNIRTIYAPYWSLQVVDISRKAGEEIIRFEYVEGGLGAFKKQLGHTLPGHVTPSTDVEYQPSVWKKNPKTCRATLRFFLA